MPLVVARAFLKSPTFSEEGEWRIVAIRESGSATEFRASGGMMLPYINLELGAPAEMPVTRIIVGPGPHPDLARGSIERFLKSVGMGQAEVEASPIPLRA